MALFSLSNTTNPVSTTGKNTLVPLPTANTVVPLVTADATRLGMTLQNLGSRTVFVGFANTVSTSSYAIAIAAGQAYEFPVAYTGVLFAVSATASQSINVVEMS